ncbi:MAG: hypothetical protein QXU40_01730, partial [Candidatus Pacearchaeota archaeon]
MEKKYSFLVIFIILSLSIFIIFISYFHESKVTGFVITNQNTEFNNTGNFLIFIPGYFIDRITQDDVFFYRDHERVPIVYDVLKVEDGYYISAILLNKRPGNYSLIIKNVRHKEGIRESRDDIIKNFSIKEGVADFYVTPGLLLLSNPDNFSIEIQNLKNEILKVRIITPNELYVFNDLNEIDLSPGGSKEIHFKINKGAVQKSSFFSTILFLSENTN